MGRGEYREIDHTADLGLDLSGPDPAAVLEAAARGLIRLLAGGEPPPGSPAHRSVELAAAGWPEALKAWCERVYRLLEDERFAALGAVVEAPGPDRVRGALDGVIVEPARLSEVSELKAVTWHELAFEADAAGGWRARVIFDV